MTDNITETVDKARQGDRDAFAFLYTEYFTPVYKFILFRVRDRHTAEDLSQTVFTRAFSGVGDFAGKAEVFLPWLYRIARNAVIDHGRKGRDVVVYDPDAEITHLFEERETATRDAEERERQETVGRALLELSDDQRELITLRYINDLPYSKISEILDKTEEALRALNSRAMKALRNQIKDV